MPNMALISLNGHPTSVEISPPCPPSRTCLSFPNISEILQPYAQNFSKLQITLDGESQLQRKANFYGSITPLKDFQSHRQLFRDPRQISGWISNYNCAENAAYVCNTHFLCTWLPLLKHEANLIRHPLLPVLNAPTQGDEFSYRLQ